MDKHMAEDKDACLRFGFNARPLEKPLASNDIDRKKKKHSHKIKLLANELISDMHGVNVSLVDVDGHMYIISSSFNGGISIIHAESCQCKKNCIEECTTFNEVPPSK